MVKAPGFGSGYSGSIPLRPASEAHSYGADSVLEGELLSFCQKYMAASASGEKKALSVKDLDVRPLVHQVKVVAECPL